MTEEKSRDVSSNMAAISRAQRDQLEGKSSGCTGRCPCGEGGREGNPAIDRPYARFGKWYAESEAVIDSYFW